MHFKVKSDELNENEWQGLKAKKSDTLKSLPVHSHYSSLLSF